MLDGENLVNGCCVDDCGLSGMEILAAFNNESCVDCWCACPIEIVPNIILIEFDAGSVGHHGAGAWSATGTSPPTIKATSHFLVGGSNTLSPTMGKTPIFSWVVCTHRSWVEAALFYKTARKKPKMPHVLHSQYIYKYFETVCAPFLRVMGIV